MQSPVSLYDPFNPCEKNRTVLLEGHAEVKGNIYRTFLAKTYGAPVPLCFVSEPSETSNGPKKYYLSVDKTKISITSGIIIEPKVNSATPVKTSVNVILLSAKDGRNCYLRFANGELFAEWRSVLSHALVEVLCHEAIIPLYTGRLSSIRLKNCLYTCSTLVEESDNPYVLQIKRIIAIKEDVTRAMETLQSNPSGLTKPEMQSILRAAKSELSLQSDPDVLFLTHLATLQGCGLTDVGVLCKGLDLYTKNTDHPIWKGSGSAVESVKENLTSKFSLYTNRPATAAVAAVKTPAAVGTTVVAVGTKKNETVTAAPTVSSILVTDIPAAPAAPLLVTPKATSETSPLSDLSPLRETVHFVTEATANDGTTQVAVVVDGVSIAKIKRRAGLARLTYKKVHSPVKAARTPVKRTSTELSPMMADRSAAASVVTFSSGTHSGTPVTATKSVLSSGVKSSLAMSGGGSAGKHRRHISFNQVVSSSDGTPSRLLAPLSLHLSPKTPPASARKAASVSGVLSNTRSLTPMNDKQIKAIKDLQIQNIVQNYLTVMETVVEEVKTGTANVPSGSVGSAIAAEKPSESADAVKTQAQIGAGAAAAATETKTKSPRRKAPKSPSRKSQNGSGMMSPSASAAIGVKVFDENVHSSGNKNTTTTSASGGNRAALSNLSASKVNSRPHPPLSGSGTTAKADLEKPHAGSMIKSALKSIAKVSVSELTIRGNEEFPYVEQDQEMVGCYKKMNKVLELLKPMDDEPPEVRFKSIMKTFNISFDAVKSPSASRSAVAAEVVREEVPAAGAAVPPSGQLQVNESSAAFLETLRNRKNSVSRESTMETAASTAAGSIATAANVETDSVVKTESDSHLQQEKTAANASSAAASPVTVTSSLSCKCEVETDKILTPKVNSATTSNGCSGSVSRQSSRVSMQECRAAISPSGAPSAATPVAAVTQMQYCSPQVSLCFDNIIEDLQSEEVRCSGEEEEDCEVTDRLDDCCADSPEDNDDNNGNDGQSGDIELIELQSESTKATINRLAILLLVVYLVAGICFVALTFQGYQRSQRSAAATRLKGPSLNLDKSQPILLLPAPPSKQLYSDQIFLPEPRPEYKHLTKSDMMNRLTTGRWDQTLLNHYFIHTLSEESDATEYSDNFDYHSQWAGSFGTMTVKIGPKRTSLMSDLKEMGKKVVSGLRDDWLESVESI